MDFMNMLYGSNGGGGGGGRVPLVTFFEQNAEETMVSMVGPALRHILSVVAARYPRPLLTLYNNFPESHALLLAFLHHQSLFSSGLPLRFPALPYSHTLQAKSSPLFPFLSFMKMPRSLSTSTD